MRYTVLLGILGWLALTLASPVVAQPFTYQGVLKQNGQPANGTLSMSFKLFTALTGGAQVGSTITQNVAVQNGLFTVELNFGTVWDGSDRYLEISVGSTVLSPRVKITPTPYASTAFFAQRPWQTSGSNIFYNAGNVGIGTSSPSARLSLGGDNANTKLAIWDGGASGVMGFGVGPSQFRIHLPSPSNRFSFLDAPAGNEILTIQGNGDMRLANDRSIFGLDQLVGFNDLRLYGDATGGPDVYIAANGNVGIGTSSPSVRLSLGGDNANTKLAIWDGGASGSMGFGVGPSQFRIHLPSPSNRFSFLDAPAGNEILTIQGSGNVGIGTTSPSTKLHIVNGNLRVDNGEFQSWGHIVLHPDVDNNGDDVVRFVDSTGNETMRIDSNGNVGIGVASPVGKLHVAHNQPDVALLQGSSTIGTWLRLANSSPGGRIWSLISSGSENSEGTGRLLFVQEGVGARMVIDQDGRVGIGASPDARLEVVDNSLGMRIFATDNTTEYTSALEAYSYAARTYTIYAYSGATVGTPVAVYAHNSSVTGTAVFADGNLVTVGAKAFRIDHPLYPATHYLNHFCTEGPDPYNAYSGIVVLDSNGEAWVQLPDYFEAANRDPRYTLTPIGAPMPNLHVAVEVQNNRFKIAGGAPGKKVSWRIEAIRDDPIIRWCGYQTEQEKPSHEIGKYLRPEAYGLPPEMGISPLPPQPSHSRNPSRLEGAR